jgi:hypothetical protein
VIFYAQEVPNQKFRRLPWTESFDEDENSIWEAPSAFLDGEDGAPFMWRLTQRLMNNFLFWTDQTSDSELIEGVGETYASLTEAKSACEAYNQGIMHECSLHFDHEAL